MATWKCGHYRRDEWGMAHLSTSEVFEYCAAHFVGPQVAAVELMRREQPCPACTKQARSARNHWAALALASVLMGFLLAWGCR